jgi:RNA polymerase sigma factor (TIGR02999 family)
MSATSPGAITRLLAEAAQGSEAARADLWQEVYGELRRLARSKLARESGQTLQTTALVHEAYLRLTGGDAVVAWENRRHFFAAAAEAMRRVLIDQARSRGAAKRGAGQRPIALGELQVAIGGDLEADELLALDEALTRLGELDPARARVVELRFFAGLTEVETAQVLGTSPRSVSRLWAGARAWLYSHMATAGAR